jgi:hypothetical protein
VTNEETPVTHCVVELDVEFVVGCHVSTVLLLKLKELLVLPRMLRMLFERRRPMQKNYLEG